MALISHKHKFIFIHVFKTGGLAVRESVRLLDPRREEIGGLHCTAADVKHILPVGMWSEYYKFVFIRNPFDWMLSIYHFTRFDKENLLHAEAMRLGFNEFVEFYIAFSKTNPRNQMWGANKTVSQTEMLSENGKLLVDFVGKQENLQDGMTTVFHALGLTTRALQKVNVVMSDEHKSNRSLYDYNSIGLVIENYKADFERGNYSTNIFEL